MAVQIRPLPPGDSSETTYFQGSDGFGPLFESDERGGLGGFNADERYDRISLWLSDEGNASSGLKRRSNGIPDGIHSPRLSDRTDGRARLRVSGLYRNLVSLLISSPTRNRLERTVILRCLISSNYPTEPAVIFGSSSGLARTAVVPEYLHYCPVYHLFDAWR